MIKIAPSILAADLINIIDSESTYSSIGVNQSSIGDGFGLEISSEIVFNDDIDLVLDISFGDSNWNFYIQLSNKKNHNTK